MNNWVRNGVRVGLVAAGIATAFAGATAAQAATHERPGGEGFKTMQQQAPKYSYTGGYGNNVYSRGDYNIQGNGVAGVDVPYWAAGPITGGNAGSVNSEGSGNMQGNGAVITYADYAAK